MTKRVDDVSIRLRQEIDDDTEFRAVTNVKADIFIDDGTCKIGKIRAWLIHRHKIPTGRFYTAFDSHSQTCQWLGCALMEPRLGRIRLESLAPFDDHNGGFMIIHKFEIASNEHQIHRSSDLETVALFKFLQHRSVVSSVSTFVHVLELDHYREDANPFLRNGFFQDPALALDGGDSDRILVASSNHTKMCLKSHRAAAAIQLIAILPDLKQPSEVDIELLNYVKQKCPRIIVRPEDEEVDPAKKKKIAKDIAQFLREGASISRSHALIEAVAHDWLPLVKYLIKKDPSAINCADHNRFSPLMMSAIQAAGKTSADDETTVLEYLLSHDADKNMQDKNGMTAYGHFVNQRLEYDEMNRGIRGRPGRSKSPANYICSTDSGRLIQSKLVPPDGVSASDKRGGARPGIVVFDDDDVDALFFGENDSEDDSSYYSDDDSCEEDPYDWETREYRYASEDPYW